MCIYIMHVCVCLCVHVRTFMHIHIQIVICMDVCVVVQIGQTALKAAAEYGRCDVVTFLAVKCKANVNRGDKVRVYVCRNV